MQQVKVNLGDQLIILKPVAFGHLATVGTLFVELHALWAKHGYALADLLISEDSPLAIDLMTKIGNLHRRADVPGQMGFDVKALLEDLPQMESLFFMDRDSDSDRLDLTQGCQLLRLNRFDAQKKYQQAMEKAVREASQVVETQQQTSEQTSPDSSDTKQQETSSKAKT